MRRRSRTGGSCSSARSRCAAAARTSCRRRSHRCTPASSATGPQIAALYGELARLTDSPVVELSRAVAIAEEQGPAAGLEIIDGLALEDYLYLHSTRGELLRRLGRTAEARDAYLRALALVHDDAERRLLERRLAEIGRRRAAVKSGSACVT